jgi:hypothetical protein
MHPMIRWIWGSLLLLTLLAAGLGLGVAAAQTGQTASLGEPTPKPGDKTGDKTSDPKKLFITVGGAPWRNVIEWLADKTGLEIATTDFPTGTFNFKPGKDASGKPKEYTVGEIFDVLNESLYKQKWTLLRKGHQLWVWPASDKVPDWLVPDVTLKELAERGETELVRMVVKLKNTDPNVVAVDIKKALGAFGEVSPLPALNQLWLQGRADAVKKALAILDELEKGPQIQFQTLNYICKSIRAVMAEDHLKKHIPDAAEQITVKTKDGQTTVTKKLTISADEANNTVLLSGAPSKVSQAEDLLKNWTTPRSSVRMKSTSTSRSPSSSTTCRRPTQRRWRFP